MDDSMNSVHSISAMDISPASSPKFAMNTLSSNPTLLQAFHQQQELLSNALFNGPNMYDYPANNQNAIISDDYDNNGKSICLYSTVLTDNNDTFKPQLIPDETNQIRQRITTEPISSTVESIPSTKKTETNSSGRSCHKLLLLLPILIFISYLIYLHLNTTANSQPSRSSTWKNASEYLTQHLIGQDQGLQEFKDSIENHKNFSIVLIQGPIGTGKSYLASLLEKFLSTTLISTNTLLGLSSHHWIEPDRLALYFLSNLSPSAFQYLIIDDLDLLSNNETYCQTLTTALHLLQNNSNKNLFILLLQTGQISRICKKSFDNIITKAIQFHMLQRHHVQICIQNEAYIQNVQPSFNNQQIENILNELEYMNEQGIAYSTTGCKQIPSLVMLESRKRAD